MKTVHSKDSNVLSDSNNWELTQLLRQLSQLRIKAKSTLDRIETETNQLRRIHTRLEQVSKEIQEFANDRILVNTAEVDDIEFTDTETRNQRYKALIPKYRIEYRDFRAVRSCTEFPEKGSLVVILNNYKSATDKLPQQGVIGVVAWRDLDYIGITISQGVTYRKKYSSCGILDPNRVRYKKEFPISDILWQKILKK